MKWGVSLVALLAVCLSAGAQTLKPADLLFHVSPSENAITAVTPAMIDHVAIYLGTDSVIEAIAEGVVITSLSKMLQREEGYYLHGRIKGVDPQRTLSNARQFLGRAYDQLYLQDNEAIYCSELVQLSAVDKDGHPLLTTIPMSFHDASGRITDYWTDFYQQHHMEVPEGQPGTNPGDLSQRKNVKLYQKRIDQHYKTNKKRGKK